MKHKTNLHPKAIYNKLNKFYDSSLPLFLYILISYPLMRQYIIFKVICLFLYHVQNMGD